MTSHGRRCLAAAAAGGTLALGAPPIEFWPSTFVAIALFGLAVHGASTRRAALYGWLMGTCATLGAFHWIVGTVTRFTTLPLPVALLAYVLLSCLAGLTLAVAAALAGACGPVLGAPVALALGILVTERWAPSIFPWQLASPLIVAPWIRQCADVVGVSGLGALLAGTLMVLARELRARLSRGRVAPPPRAATAAAAALFVAAWVYGAFRTVSVQHAMDAAPTLRVELVQPAIPPTVRWEEGREGAILEGLQGQTRAALRARPDLVIWSEAAYPYPLPQQASFDGAAGPLVYPELVPAPIVFGAVTFGEHEERYNAAMVRQPDGSISAPVAKQVLVPFGEYVPVVGGIEWVRRAFERARGLTPGTEPELLTTDTGLRLGVLNCFEDTLPYLGARVAGADLLVNMTNDAWFGRGSAPWQHLMLARWRAIETRRELLRAVNTGVTCHVDALGRVASSAPLWRPATLLARPHRLALRPLAPVVIRYAPPLSLAVLLLALAVRVYRRLSKRRV